MNHRQLREIAQICGGIPRLLSLVAGFIRCEDDKQRAVRIIMEEKEKWKGRIGEYVEHYVFAYENLPPLLKDPFLDICKFSNGWQWDEVADILGELQIKRALLTRDTNMTTQVHDVILKVAEGSDKGMRLTLTSASQIQDILYRMEQKDLQGMKGLWLREIKIEDPLQISASKLDFMHRSLRILSLGDITVEGKKFENLVFFQSGLGSIDLPFDVSKSEELTYLAYHQPEELNVYKMPEDLKKDAIDRMRRSQVLQISSRCLRPLRNLRILRLIGLTQLEKLPADLGDLNGLHELTLSRVPCIEKLPPTISKLQSLRVLRLDRCSRFRKLPEELGGGLVNSLHKLILSGCNLIEELPISISKLQFLKNIEMDFFTCQLQVGVDKLQGKIILLHLGPLKEIDILRDVLTEGYVTEKERCNLEIISIVKGSRITEVERFAKEVPWLVYQNPRTITKAKRYFLYEKCSWKSRYSGWRVEESEHSTGIMVIERNGRIPSYEGLPLPNLRMILDRWGWKAYPFTEEKIEELKEEEWNDLHHFSPLMFLVKHLGEVKERMLSPKMILLCGGVRDESQMTEFTSFLRDEFKGQWDSVHLIYVPCVIEGEVSEVAMRDAEMEGMTLLTLSKHDTIRFWGSKLFSEQSSPFFRQNCSLKSVKIRRKF